MIDSYVRDIADYVYYVYRRNNWMLDLSRHFRNFSQYKIEKPIFLLRTQGGGLTLLSRMLRRNSKVISVTGNYNYWAGADEMQNVLGPILPKSLTGIKHKASPDDVFDIPRGWLYATDRLIDKYRSNENDVTTDERNQFQKIIRWIISKYNPGVSGMSRLVDKSQIFTVKVSYIDAMLQGLNSLFVLITRNPYAVCFRSVDEAKSLKKLEGRFSYDERLSFAAQHWANSMKFALMDSSKVENFLILKVEDLLSSPEKHLKILCNFLDLEYMKEMLPQKNDQFPLGTIRKSRWYPIRKNINEQYLEKIDKNSVDIIVRECEQYADQFNYTNPLH